MTPSSLQVIVPMNVVSGTALEEYCRMCLISFKWTYPVKDGLLWVVNK